MNNKIEILKYLPGFLLAIIFSLYFWSVGHAQNTAKQPNEVTSLNKISLYFPGVALEREQKISRTSTLSFGINYQFTFIRSYYVIYDHYLSGIYMVATNGRVTHDSKLKAVPGASINYRYYYNLNERIAKGKNTNNNSGSYLSMDVASIFPRLSDKSNQYDYQLSITPNWGIQRNVAKTANGEFAIGPSININPYETLLSVGLKAGFSFIF